MEQPGRGRPGSELIPTPIWIMIVRIFQITLSLIVLGLCGAFMKFLYSEALGFAVICCIFTWVISGYNLIAEKIPACHKAYNTYATLALDLFMVIFWLAAMGALAAYRAVFNTNVNASCADNATCQFNKRGRGGTVPSNGIIMASRDSLQWLSAAAGMSALIMILYVVSFAYVCHFWRITRVRSSSSEEQEKFTAEMNTGLPPQQTSAQQSQPLLNQPSNYVGVQGYVPTQEGPVQYYQPQDVCVQKQPEFQQHGTAPYDPYGQQVVDNQFTSVPPLSGQEVIYVQQPIYSPHGTPAPGQIYQPPPH
ncbi:hypothetical protein Micbo1qcDRAFT_221130 [Microdochium bolleyi]|uniref:MARVEL domain-containing protein n=1 Tax=Microdochium bolleyi TaxID=196109 RepID=A0A136JBR8_9PEZI|nr:hypothetical protein Micbo1qcDRAFT_221130 [Microdochium bolleyi]